MTRMSSWLQKNAENTKQKGGFKLEKVRQIVAGSNSSSDPPFALSCGQSTPESRFICGFKVQRPFPPIRVIREIRG